MFQTCFVCKQQNLVVPNDLSHAFGGTSGKGEYVVPSSSFQAPKIVKQDQHRYLSGTTPRLIVKTSHAPVLKQDTEHRLHEEPKAVPTHPW